METVLKSTPECTRVRLGASAATISSTSPGRNCSVSCLSLESRSSSSSSTAMSAESEASSSRSCVTVGHEGSEGAHASWSSTAAASYAPTRCNGSSSRERSSEPPKPSGGRGKALAGGGEAVGSAATRSESDELKSEMSEMSTVRPSPPASSACSLADRRLLVVIRRSLVARSMSAWIA